MKYEIEEKINQTIPSEIKRIIETNDKLTITVDDEMEECIILSQNQIVEAYDEWQDLFDYSIIPFASIEDDYICLYYKNRDISIIYWSTERALEAKELAIFELYSSYNDFLNIL